MKNSDAPAVKREAEEEWGKKKMWITAHDRRPFLVRHRGAAPS
jgi:hypothetical protein